MTNKEEKKINEALGELESIAEWFDKQEDIDLEKGLEKIQSGAKIIKDLKSKLKVIENKFEEIKKDLEEDAGDE